MLLGRPGSSLFISQTRPLVHDARNKYASFKGPSGLIPDSVHAKYDRCKFKSICDDLGLANLIVRARANLTVTGVGILSGHIWTRPTILLSTVLASPKQARQQCADYMEGKPPKIAFRYFKCIGIYIRVLEEEEAKMPHQEKELSSPIKWSQESGAMWFHMLLVSGFNDHHSLLLHSCANISEPLSGQGLRRCLTTEPSLVHSQRERSDLEKYDRDLEKLVDIKALVGSGSMAKEEFIANALLESVSDPAPRCSNLLNQKAEFIAKVQKEERESIREQSTVSKEIDTFLNHAWLSAHSNTVPGLHD